MRRSKDHDQPVIITGEPGETDGKHYYSVTESGTGVPEDELDFEEFTARNLETFERKIEDSKLHLPMIKILADQNFNGRIIRGLMARIPELDVVRTQDFGLEGLTDYRLLDWAAEQDRVILTHDERTFHVFAYEKMTKGEKMSGVIVVPDQIPIGRAIDDLEIAFICKFDNEWENNITRIPI